MSRFARDRTPAPPLLDLSVLEDRGCDHGPRAVGAIDRVAGRPVGGPGPSARQDEDNVTKSWRIAPPGSGITNDHVVSADTARPVMPPLLVRADRPGGSGPT